MLKYLVLYSSLFMAMYRPLQIPLKQENRKSSEVICMVPPPGNGYSKIDDSTEQLNEGCKITSKTITNNDGSTTNIITATFNKKETVDKNGRVVKQTDTSTANFQQAKDIFFSKEKKHK